MPIRILIADDHDIIRAGLRSVLETNLKYAVVAEAGSGEEALELARAYGPDLVIMDVSMPGMSGIEATTAIVRDLPRTRVLALSMHESRDYLARMLKAGASGYLLKIYAAKEIIGAVDAVMEGRTYLSPSMIGGVIKDIITDGGAQAAKLPAITPRQFEVMKHILSGKSLKEIAFNLNLSVKTLEKHRLQVMAKLGANSSAELAMIAVRLGLVDPWNLTLGVSGEVLPTQPVER
jgi:DNA-binding NarL/FixJ family response regulator